MRTSHFLTLLLAAAPQGLATANTENPLISSDSYPHFIPTSLRNAYSTRMIKSVISRQQGIVSSGQSTSTLESGMLSLAIQAWLGRYAPTASNSTLDHDAQLVAEFRNYSGSILEGLSTTTSFDNYSYAEKLPLDRMTVAQAIQNRLFDGEGFSAGGGEDASGVVSADGGNVTVVNGTADEWSVLESLVLETLNTSLTYQNRNENGGFWYYTYSNWSYLDGTVSFLPHMSARPTHWNLSDALLQINLLYNTCLDNNSSSATSSNLLFHGYDATKQASWANPQTGASPYVWGRSLGWYLTGLVNAWEVLETNYDDADDFIPVTPFTTSYPATTGLSELRDTITAQFGALAPNMARYADRKTGAWWQLTTFPGREGNYLESSSTALFIFVLLKGVRLGLIEDQIVELRPYYNQTSTTNNTTTTTSSGNSNSTDSNNAKDANGDAPTYTLVQIALRAYEHTITHFVTHANDTTTTTNGTAITDEILGYNDTVTVCSLNSTASYEYYTSQPINPNAPLGEAAFVLASLEVERLLSGDWKA